MLLFEVILAKSTSLLGGFYSDPVELTDSAEWVVFVCYRSCMRLRGRVLSGSPRRTRARSVHRPHLTRSPLCRLAQPTASVGVSCFKPMCVYFTGQSWCSLLQGPWLHPPTLPHADNVWLLQQAGVAYAAPTPCAGVQEWVPGPWGHILPQECVWRLPVGILKPHKLKCICTFLLQDVM